MEQLDRIEVKIDRVYEILTEHSLSLNTHELLHKQNTEDLAIHIKRTNILQEKIEAHESEIQQRLKDNDEKLGEALIPVKIFQFIWKNTPKLAAFITALGMLAGALAYLLKD